MVDVVFFNDDVTTVEFVIKVLMTVFFLPKEKAVKLTFKVDEEGSAVAGTYTIPAGYTSGGSVSLTNVSDCVASNILSGKSILGVSGSLAMPSISQDSGTKVLSIS